MVRPPITIMVHPHACGEHSVRLDSDLINNGSSPRLWGTRWMWGPGSPGVRFIPTPVGNTVAIRDTTLTTAVHPHACGEHNGLAGISPQGSGSSPRLWGTPFIQSRPISERRFIPTPVGNTKKKSLDPGRTSVHPHACGEHQFRIDMFSLCAGSSPRLWGTLQSQYQHQYC